MVFAGATVVISLLGMFLMGIGFISGLGVTASLTVAAHGARLHHPAPGAPRLLGAQHRAHQVARSRRGRLHGARPGGGRPQDRRRSPGSGFGLAIITIVLGFFLPPLQREVKHRPPKPRRETAAYRWSRIIQRRPWPFAIGATAFLLVLAIPFLDLRLGFSDESNFADDTTTKQAYDLVVEGFGEGFNAPVYLVAEVDGAEQAGALAAVNEAIEADPAVASIMRTATQRPGRADRGPLAGHPDGRRPGSRHHAPRRPAA